MSGLCTPAVVLFTDALKQELGRTQEAPGGPRELWEGLGVYGWAQQERGTVGDDGDTEVLGPQSVIIKAGGRKQKIVPPPPKMTVAELGKATALSVAHRVWQQTRQDN